MEKIYSGSAGLAVSNQIRPETMLESVVSRLNHTVSRIHNSAERANSIANTIIGYAGETEATGKSMPASVPSSVSDYLAEIDAALNKLDQHLGRLS